MGSPLDDILPSDKALLEAMIDSNIPLDDYFLTKYHLPRLDQVAIKSNPGFPLSLISLFVDPHTV